MTAATISSRYFLAHHAYACSVDNHIVILDLHNDDYLSLEPRFAGSLFQLLSGCSNTLPPAMPGKNQEELEQLATALLEKGLITENCDAGKTLTPPVIDNPRIDFMGYYELVVKPTISVSHVIRFLKAVTISTIQLRQRSLESIIQRILKRKQKLKTHKFSGDKDIHYAWDLVEIFQSLTPLLFSKKEKCLYNSLTLIEFLSYYGVYPDLVFGVKMGPFSAHCWVQKGNILFNDTAAHTTSFTPILVI